jgi:D-alanyl-D-alanine-carboxypeptidase/D-alanyl-D-alanine-endopeptidase
MRRMMCMLLLLGLGSFITAEVPGQEDPVEAKIRSIIKERVDKYHRNFGIVVGIVSKKGNQIFSYGKMGKGSTQDVDGDTVFELGSVTKTFTATLLADMVERGELSLDDPIDQFLPGSVKVPIRNGKKITLIDLATHTSGLPGTPENSKSRDNRPGFVGYTEQQLYDFLSRYTLTRDIGSKYEYSNMGMGLLGHILSLKTGRPFDELVRERICAPLKMDSTARELSPELQKRKAEGIYLDGQKSQGWRMPPVFAGAGGLRSTANDMLKFLAANLGLIKSPLGPAFGKTHEGIRDIRGEPLKVGLAWLVFTKENLKIILHTGGTEANSSFVGLDPGKKVGVVVLSNSNLWIPDIGYVALTGKLDSIQLLDYQEPEVLSVDPAVLQAYVGTYQTAPTFFIKVTIENGRLFAQGTGQPRFELFPKSGNTFFLKAIRATITFVKDRQGKVIKAIIHTIEGDEVSKKIK